MDAEQSLWKAWYSEINMALGTEHIMKITRQNRETGLGLSHQNPGILNGLVVQAADLHWETAEERREELERSLHSCPQQEEEREIKEDIKGVGGMTFQKALSTHQVGKQGGQRVQQEGHQSFSQPDLQILSPWQHGRCLETWPSMSNSHHFKTQRFCSTYFRHTDSYWAKLWAFFF